MKKGQYAAIVLAAGFSSRMQAFKPVLSVGQETIADHLMATFLKNDVEVYLVVSYKQDKLKARIKTHNIYIVENEDFQQGMFSSVQAGLRSLKHEYQGAFIAPVDTPLVSGITIQKLLRAGTENPDAIIHPIFLGGRGHPPLIPSLLFPVILDWQGELKLKAVLNAYENGAIDVKVHDSNILFDIDEPADYEKLLERYRKKNRTHK